MITAYETNATYGSHQTRCTVFVVEVDGMHWYAIEGSQNVNCAPHEIERGQDLETIEDTDFFTADNEIESLEQLEREVLEYLGMAENDEPETDEPELNEFIIIIDKFDDAAMMEDAQSEVLAALRACIKKIEENGLENCAMVLRDTNGNKIGTMNAA